MYLIIFIYEFEFQIEKKNKPWYDFIGNIIGCQLPTCFLFIIHYEIVFM